MSSPKVAWATIDAKNAGQRVDNFLLGYFRKIPKSRIYRAIRSGEVRVNKGRIKPIYRLKEGDLVRIPPITAENARQHEVSPERQQRLEEQIIFEDDHLMVINKPSGLSSHSGSGDPIGVIETMRASRENQPFLELAHRIDKETSGVLILAKSRAALLEVQQAMQSAATHKQYTLMVKGHWKAREQVVQHALEKGDDFGMGKMRVDEGGQSAETVFTSIQLFQERLTLLSAQIGTGRTHQIRVHAQEEGYPIVGDKRYGDFAHNRVVGEQGLHRMFLHASNLRLKMPISGQNYEFSAPLAVELQRWQSQLTPV
jgi:23S rRNA pseudouridine955/2504/2580 synthase